MSESPLTIAVHHDVADSLSHGRFKPVAQRSIVTRAFVEFLAREFGRLTERDDAGNVLGTRTPFALLMPADVLSVQSDATSNEERADAFRRVQFVTRHRQQI